MATISILGRPVDHERTQSENLGSQPSCCWPLLRSASIAIACSSPVVVPGHQPAQVRNPSSDHSVGCSSRIPSPLHMETSPLVMSNVRRVAFVGPPPRFFCMKQTHIKRTLCKPSAWPPRRLRVRTLELTRPSCKRCFMSMEAQLGCCTALTTAAEEWHASRPRAKSRTVPEEHRVVESCSGADRIVLERGGYRGS